MSPAADQDDRSPGAVAEHGATRSLRIVIAASVLSKIADWQLGVVVPLAVLSETDSPAIALAAFALRALPFIASPLLGSVIDRFDKRTVFAWAQVVQALCMVLVALLLTDRVALGVLLLLSGFGAVAVTITGQFVLIPKLVEADKQAVAVAKLSSAIELSKVVGLLLGGFAITVRGPEFASWIIAGLYAAAGLVALFLPRIPSTGVRTGIRQDLLMGLRWVAKPDILWLVVTLSVSNLAVGELETVLVTVFGERRLDARLISLVLAAGLLLGALGSRLSPYVLPQWPVQRRILLFQGALLVFLGVLALPALAATVVGYAAVALCLGAGNVASITYRQGTIPVDIAGRVNAAIRMFITGAIPLSGLIYAWATRFDGFLFWLPGLLLSALSLAVWAGHTYRTARAQPARIPVERNPS
ncbi:MFS transporter [Kitasatospora sp. NBC_00240]|uniref:MFS transporter n=1 Tax=Kitasatospora sp. NBC_00240 TaxID=2903567 RepID=UPI00225AFA95|nr:MFS transporter [Kitasatospora sp. NBC_00240]MCX5214528.1 MFS transporter [Kitasatospora sp. NBC_00240]